MPRTSVAHSGAALQSVAEGWQHTHGTNPDGHIICIPCMAELLLDIHKMVLTDTVAMTSQGKPIQVVEK